MINNLKITKKRHLEIALQQILRHPVPKVHLEQYATPAGIAADVLWNAYTLGDIEDKKVVDLGCGTGIFTIGAALLGARESLGVDIDSDAIALAKTQAEKFGLSDITYFISKDIRDFHESAGTVIQNPPFGVQMAHRKEADRIFMCKAVEIAPVIYSFHIKETEKFVENFFDLHGGMVTHKLYYRFPIYQTYNFHKKEMILVDVVVVRVERLEE
ncbi:MAG: methyltransferase [Euryarchaeota archaeon]|nr:methyltransferase [Euryarchaeota archaeon]